MQEIVRVCTRAKNSALFCIILVQFDTDLRDTKTRTRGSIRSSTSSFRSAESPLPYSIFVKTSYKICGHGHRQSADPNSAESHCVSATPLDGGTCRNRRAAPRWVLHLYLESSLPRLPKWTY